MLNLYYNPLRAQAPVDTLAKLLAVLELTEKPVTHRAKQDCQSIVRILNRMVRLSKNAREIERDERESRGSTYRMSYGELFKDSKKKEVVSLKTRSRSRSQERSEQSLSIVVGNLPTELTE